MDYTHINFFQCYNLKNTRRRHALKQHCGVANRNADIDLERSIGSVSKVLQTEPAVSQRFKNLDGGGGSSTYIIIPCQTGSCVKNFSEGGTDSKKM